MPKKHYSIIIEQDPDGFFIVTCPSFTGCHSYGSTIEEAIENVTEAIGACVEDDFSEEPTSFIGVRDIEIAV